MTENTIYWVAQRVLHHEVGALIMAEAARGSTMADNSSFEPEDGQPKWRGRIEVLLLVVGGLVLLIPTLAIFLAGGD